jgi:excisionase family DNA binding protein
MEAETKLFLTGEAARALEVSALTIRQWDREGRIKSTRTLGGFRIFTAEEIRRVIAERQAQKAR